MVPRNASGPPTVQARMLHRSVALTLGLGALVAASSATAQDAWRCTEPSVEAWPVVATRTEAFPQPSFHTLSDRTRAAAAAALQAGDPTQALSLYERGMREAPRDPRMQCGAALAAARARRGPLAARYARITEAFYGTHAVEPRESAACLYNAGLAFEVAAMPARARRAWTRSLALRPSAAVRRALRRLPAEARFDERPWPELTRRVEAWACRQFVDLSGVPCSDEEVTVQTSVDVPLGTAGELDARVIRVHVTGDAESNEWVVLALRRGATLSAVALHTFDHRAQGEYEDFFADRFTIGTESDGPAVWLETFHEEVSAHGDDRQGTITRTLYIAEPSGAAGIALRSVPIEQSVFSELLGDDGDDWHVAYRYDRRRVTQTCLRADRLRVAAQQIVGGAPPTLSDGIDRAPASERDVGPVGPPVTTEGPAADTMTPVRLFSLPR